MTGWEWVIGAGLGLVYIYAAALVVFSVYFDRKLRYHRTICDQVEEFEKGRKE
jgi:hypothetical protein